jgi:hypothetical protein
LRRLGLAPGVVRTLGLIESGQLALAGAIAGALGYWLGSGRVHRLPLAGLQAARGDLELACWQLGAVVVLVTLGMGALGSRPARGSTPAKAAARAPAAVSGARALPMAGCLVLLALARLLNRGAGLALTVAALLLVVAALPWSMPWQVARLGALLTRSRRPACWLAGRRLAHSPVGFGRPAVAVGVLLFIAGSLTGIYLRLSQVDSGGDSGIETATLVQWRDARSADVDALRRRLEEAGADVVVATVTEHDRAPAAVWFRSCTDAATVLEITLACGSAGELAPNARAETTRRFGLPGGVDPAAAPIAGDIGAAIVIPGPGATRTIAPALARATNGYLGAVNVAEFGPQWLAPPQSRDWLLAAGTVGLATLLIMLAQTYLGRVLDLDEDDGRLQRLGLLGAQLRAVQRWTLLGPVFVALPTGSLAAAAFIWVANDVELAAPATAWLVAETLVVGLALVVLTLLAGRFQRRAVVRPAPKTA